MTTMAEWAPVEERTRLAQDQGLGLAPAVGRLMVGSVAGEDEDGDGQARVVVLG